MFLAPKYYDLEGSFGVICHSGFVCPAHLGKTNGI